jgi:predicted amidohydrolase YtcJ
MRAARVPVSSIFLGTSRGVVGRFCAAGVALLVTIGCTPQASSIPDASSLPDAGGSNDSGFTTVVFNAQVYGALAGSDAVAIAGDTIVALGASAILVPQCQQGCVTLDAAAGFLSPGFHDAHVHIFTAGKEGAELRVSGSDAGAIAAALTAYANANPGEEWLLGAGWDLAGFGADLPTAAEIDNAIPAGVKVALTDRTGHNLWANDAALAAAGITGATPDPVGGTIVKVAGRPTGLLLNKAEDLVVNLEPPLSSVQINGYIQSATGQSIKNGWTAIQGGPITLDEAQDWALLSQSGAVTQRSFIWAPIEDVETNLAGWQSFVAGLPPESRVQLSGFKGFVDGVWQGSTAALVSPYSNRPGIYGVTDYTQARLDQLVQEVNAAGYPVMLHAIGDFAVEMALTAFEHSTVRPPHPNRVEHASLVDPADQPRFAAAGVTASVQPCFTYFANAAANYLTAAIGPARLAYAYPWKSLQDAGAFLVLGTDFPPGGLAEDPVNGLYCATQRTYADGTPFTTAQALDAASAMEGFTLNPAKSVGLDKTLGRIAVGFKADLTLLDHNPLTSQARTLAEDPVRWVMINGDMQ